jgi:hypothetical protein
MKFKDVVNEKDEDKPFEIDYAQGLKNTRKRKKFKNNAAYEKWLNKYGDDITVYSTSFD